MTLTDLNTDCVFRILELMPLKSRFQTRRHICNRWTETVKHLCLRQKKLILQLGTGNCWNEIRSKIIKAYCFQHDVLAQADHFLYTLNVEFLNEELAAFLTTTFPHLDTLVVVASDSTENLNLLNNFSSGAFLISAYSDKSLTTFQFFWDINTEPSFKALENFRTNFTQMIARINLLSGLKRLSLAEISAQPKFYVYSFDFPLLRTLETLDFSVADISNFESKWAPQLRARKEPMKINFQITRFSTNVHFIFLYLNSDLAVHFHMFFDIATYFDPLKDFCTKFSNLRKLDLDSYISFEVTISQLARLPYLVDLTLVMYHSTTDPPLTPLQRQLSQLKTLKHLSLKIYSYPSFCHAYFEELNFAQIFPSLQCAEIFLRTNFCYDCEYKLNWLEALVTRRVDEQTERRAEQCLTKLVSLHKNVFEVILCPQTDPWFKIVANLNCDGKKKLVFTNLLS